MEHRIERLETDMTDVKTRLTVAVPNIKKIREDIGGNKDNSTWILRLLIGGLASAVLAFIIKGGLMYYENQLESTSST
ncbi:hemolysin activation protein [Lysinibacillus sphaericus]|nr:hemolysin XhlA family protein [Lysinibacillus sphaericus]KEK12128.1 hemolysin activation protein [Lysinibacillus sphaericus]